MNEQLKHLISIDVETTGLDPERHSIISIGAVNFLNTEQFESENLLRHGAEIDGYALTINGESEFLLRSRDNMLYYTEYECLLNLIAFCDKTNSFTIIGKNPNFDRNFLLSIWKRQGRLEKEFPFTYRVINWADMAIPFMLRGGYQIPDGGISSDAFSAYLGLEEEIKPHIAINGANHNKRCVHGILAKYGL